MEIDENKNEIDLSDHNLITIEANLNAERNVNFRKGKWEEKEYYKTDADNIKIFAQVFEEKVSENIKDMEEFNDLMKKVADEKDEKKSSKRRRGENRTTMGYRLCQERD